MERRRFGRTNHMSTLAVFGAVALGKLDQPTADQVMQQIIQSGINHIDIAPSYGQAESRLGPWMPRIRGDFFLGCKTMERSKQGAIKEALESLERLQTTSFNLYQMHAITTLEELDQCMQTGGALDGLIEMREKGLTRYIGITGHGMQAPELFIKALSRFDFDSVLFPINPTLYANDAYCANTRKLLDICEEQDVGVMAIKSLAKEPWGDKDHRYHTWYLPFEKETEIQNNIDFVLSQQLTHICTAGDYRLLGKIINACKNYQPMPSMDQERLIATQSDLQTIF